MIINFIYFSFFIVLISSVGELFNNIFLKNYSRKQELINTENIVSSLFLLGFLTLIINFFFPLNNIFIKIFFFILFFYSLFLSYKKIIISISNNLLLLILTSLITFYMKVGYDGLLYHLPHQTFIKYYKIIFGLFNLH